jgi:hypothetical protein
MPAKVSRIYKNPTTLIQHTFSHEIRVALHGIDGSSMSEVMTAVTIDIDRRGETICLRCVCYRQVQNHFHRHTLLLILSPTARTLA